VSVEINVILFPHYRIVAPDSQKQLLPFWYLSVVDSFGSRLETGYEVSLVHFIQTGLADPRCALIGGEGMCTATIICVGKRYGVFSFTTGVAFNRPPDLHEEWKANPDAVLERLAREGRWEELEALMDRVPVAQ
jgi:hypothetical protein